MPKERHREPAPTRSGALHRPRKPRESTHAVRAPGRGRRDTKANDDALSCRLIAERFYQQPHHTTRLARWRAAESASWKKPKGDLRRRYPTIEGFEQWLDARCEDTGFATWLDAQWRITEAERLASGRRAVAADAATTEHTAEHGVKERGAWLGEAEAKDDSDTSCGDGSCDGDNCDDARCHRNPARRHKATERTKGRRQKLVYKYGHYCRCGGTYTTREAHEETCTYVDVETAPLADVREGADAKKAAKQARRHARERLRAQQPRRRRELGGKKERTQPDAPKTRQQQPAQRKSSRGSSNGSSSDSGGGSSSGSSSGRSGSEGGTYEMRTREVERKGDELKAKPRRRRKLESRKKGWYYIGAAGRTWGPYRTSMMQQWHGLG